QLDAKVRRQDGQIFQPPVFPVLIIVMRFLQRTEMPEGPGYLVAVSFVVTVAALSGAQHMRYIPGHTWFFSNTNLHSPLKRGANVVIFSGAWLCRTVYSEPDISVTCRYQIFC